MAIKQPRQIARHGAIETIPQDEPSRNSERAGAREQHDMIGSKQIGIPPAAANRSLARSSLARRAGEQFKQSDRKGPARGGRAMRIGKKGKRQSLDIGNNYSRRSRSSSSHSNTPHETTPSRPPSPPSRLHTSPHARASRYHSPRLPPRSPCRRAGRNETASKHATPTSDI